MTATPANSGGLPPSMDINAFQVSVRSAVPLAGNDELWQCPPLRVMRQPLLHSGRRDLVTSLLLVALLFRAYIPVGFMPAGGAPFQLELCPAFWTTDPARHQHHHDSRHHADLQDCPFGSAPAQGPISTLVFFQPPAQIPVLEAPPAESQRLVARPSRSHQPRGPPSLA